MYVRTCPVRRYNTPPCSQEQIHVYTVVRGCGREYAAAYLGIILPRI